jgi:predicted amidohydrolase YtcJ
VFPGFCDVHVHFREPGFSYKETVKRALSRRRTADIPLYVRCRTSTPFPTAWKISVYSLI